MGLFDFLRKRSALPISEEQDKLYDRETTEIIALTMDSAGAGRSGGSEIWIACQRLIGYIELHTGKLFSGYHLLHWEVNDTQRKSAGKGLNLAPECCYRLLVRKSKKQNRFGNTIPAGRSLYVVKVLERNCPEPHLSALLDEYRKPVTLTLKSGGTLTLNKRFGCYEGDVEWADSTCSLSLSLDENSQTEATAALDVLETILADTVGWDEKARGYAADQLTELADDWRGDDDPPVSRNDFFNRIKGSPSLSIDEDGEMEFTFSDDGIFAGHWIVVRGTPEEGFTDAIIEG